MAGGPCSWGDVGGDELLAGDRRGRGRGQEANQLRDLHVGPRATRQARVGLPVLPQAPASHQSMPPAAHRRPLLGGLARNARHLAHDFQPAASHCALS